MLHAGPLGPQHIRGPKTPQTNPRPYTTVDALSKRLLVVELPAGEPQDGSDCVTALFGKAFCLVAVCLLLCQCLYDGSEVLASVGLEAEAEGGSGNKIAL